MALSKLEQRLLDFCDDNFGLETIELKKGSLGKKLTKKQKDSMVSTGIPEKWIKDYNGFFGFTLTWRANSATGIDADGSIKIMDLPVVFSDWEGQTYVRNTPKNSPMRDMKIVDFFYDEYACGILFGKRKDFTFYRSTLAENEPQSLDLDIDGYIEMMLYSRGYAHWQLAIIDILYGCNLANVTEFKENMPKLFPDWSWEGFVEKFESVRLNNDSEKNFQNIVEEQEYTSEENEAEGEELYLDVFYGPFMKMETKFGADDLEFFDSNPGRNYEEHQIVAVTQLGVPMNFINKVKEFFGYSLEWKSTRSSGMNASGMIKIGDVRDVFGDWKNTTYTDATPEDSILRDFKIVDFNSSTSVAGILFGNTIDFTFYFSALDGTPPTSLDLDIVGYAQMLNNTRGYVGWHQALIHLMHQDQYADIVEKFKHDMPLLYEEWTWDSFVAKFEEVRLNKVK